MTDTAQPNDGINLTEQRLTPEARAALYPFLNRVPAPRPIPTTAARLADARACGHTPEQHRHLDGQEADDRSHARAIRELETELERATNQRDAAWKGNAQLAAERDRFARDHASAEQVATFRQGVIDLHGAELGAAGEVIAVVRDAQEQIERALARYDTQPDVTPVAMSIQQRDQIAADALLWAADRIDPGPRKDRPKPIDEQHEITMCADRGRATNLRFWAEQVLRGSIEPRPAGSTPAGLGSAPPRAQEQPEREETRWAYRWIGTDGQVYDEMDASDNAIETGEQRAHRIAAKRLTGTVRGEVVRYRVLTMPAEVVATYPAEEPA